MRPLSTNHCKNSELICWNRRGERSGNGKRKLMGREGEVGDFFPPLFHLVCFSTTTNQKRSNTCSSTVKITQVLECTSLGPRNSLTAGKRLNIEEPVWFLHLSLTGSRGAQKCFPTLCRHRGQSPNCFPVMVLHSEPGQKQKPHTDDLNGPELQKRWRLPHQLGMSPLWHGYHSAFSLCFTLLPLPLGCCWEFFCSHVCFIVLFFRPLPSGVTTVTPSHPSLSHQHWVSSFTTCISFLHGLPRFPLPASSMLNTSCDKHLNLT